MKRFAQTGMMLAGLAVLPLAAQSTSPSPSTGDMSRTTDMRSSTETMNRATDMHDDDFNFGWLGLLGLAGLAGLGRKKNHVHTDTDHVHTGHTHAGIDRDRI
jgi:MYXO-CTERM domain-containing protein